MKPLPDGERGAPAGTALVGKAFALLRQVSRRHQAGSTLTELARACGVHHATALRILRALRAEDMVAQRPGTKLYVLGPGALALSASVHPMFDVRAAVAEPLKRITRLTGGNAFFSVRDGYDSVCIAREVGVQRKQVLPQEVGARRPLCATAGGTALLMLLPPGEQAAALRYGLRQAEAVGPQRRRAIRNLVERSRRHGFGLNEDLIVPTMTGIGVAVGPREAPLGAFTVTVLSERVRGGGVARIAELLREEAGALGGGKPAH
jgi:DNA-binding IclR family transcriptional regulator